MARHFIGTTTDYLKIGGGFEATHLPISIVTWLNRSGGGVRDDMIAPSSTGGLSFSINNSNLLLVSKDAISDLGLSAGSISSGVWIHVGFTYDGTTLKFYISGFLDNTIVTGSSFNSGAPYTLGRSVPDSKVLAASLADFAGFHSILGPADFAALARGVIRPHQLKGLSLALFCPLDGYDHPVLDYSPYNNNPGIVIGTGTSLVPGPPLISPLKIVPPQNVKSTSAVSSAVFRRSLSSVGTRTGARQAVA